MSGTNLGSAWSFARLPEGGWVCFSRVILQETTSSYLVQDADGLNNWLKKKYIDTNCRDARNRQLGFLSELAEGALVEHKGRLDDVKKFSADFPLSLYEKGGAS